MAQHALSTPLRDRLSGSARALCLLLTFLLSCAAAVTFHVAAAAARPPKAHAADAQQCPEPYPAQRDAFESTRPAGRSGLERAARGPLLRTRPREGIGRRRDRPAPRAQSPEPPARPVVGFVSAAAGVRPAGCEAGRQPEARPPGRDALEDRRSARGPAHQQLLHGAVAPGGSSRRPRRSSAPTWPLTRARSRSSTPTSCTRRSVAAPPLPRCGPTTRCSGAGSTRWPRPPTGGRPSSCSSLMQSGPRLRSPRGLAGSGRLDLRYEINAMGALPPHGGRTSRAATRTRTQSATRRGS